MNYQPQYEQRLQYYTELLTTLASRQRWVNSFGPSVVIIPDAFIKDANLNAMNNVLKAMPNSENILRGILEYINREEVWKTIEKELNINDYHDFTTLITGGIEIKARVFRMGDPLEAICIDFENTTTERERNAKILEQLMYTNSSAFILDVVVNETGFGKFKVIQNAGYLTDSMRAPGEDLNAQSFVHPEDQEVVGKAIFEAIKNYHSTVEARVIGISGEYIWILVHLSANANEEGGYRITGYSQDITELVLQRKEIERRRHLLEISLNLFTVIHFTVNYDNDGNPTFNSIDINNSGDLKLGSLDDTDEFEALGMSEFYKYIYPDDRQMVEDEFRKIYETGVETRISLRLTTDDKKIRNIEAYAIPQFNNKGKVVSAIGGFNDVTNAVNKGFAELLDMYMRLLAHDSKAPISSIFNAVTILTKYSEKIDDSMRNKYLDIMRKAATIINHYINSMLSVAKLQTSGEILNPERIDLCELLKAIVEDSSIYSEEHQIITKINAESVEIDSDKDILRHIILNLITNAFKFSVDKPGSNVEVGLDVKEGIILLSIKDYGRGIPLESQNKIFNEHGRAKNVKDINGSGIGLVTIKKFVETLGYKIYFETEVNAGTTFFIEIPLVREAVEA